MKKKNLLLTFLIAATFLLGGGYKLMAQMTLPYSYGFENNNLVEEGWTIEDGYSNTGITYGNYKTGNYAFRFQSTYNTNKQYLISPELSTSTSTNGLTVSFYYKRSGGAQQKQPFRVGYSTTDNTIESIIWTYTVSTDLINYANEAYSIDFEYTNIKYIAIEYTNINAGFVNTYFDDFSFSAIAIPTCSTPTELSAEATSSTTANVTWTATGNETAWQLYCSNVSYATPANASDGDFITINTTPSYTLTGLTPNTEHFVYVRAKCGEDDYSEWTDAETFTTLNPQSLPISNGFETSISPWMMRDNYNTTNRHEDASAHGGSYSFQFRSSNSGSTQYLVSPELNGSSNGVYVNFYRKQTATGATLQVGYSSTTSVTEAFTWGSATPNAQTSSNAFVLYDCYCPANTKFVAIKYVSTGATIVYIDDISITVPPTATTNGNWNNTATWATGAVPSSSANVVISSDVTIPNGYTATANNITIDGGSLTIEDGGQLICNNAVQAIVEKNITAWENVSPADGWYFIASPINRNDLAPTDVNHMITDNIPNDDESTPRTYDLYGYDATASKPWVNYRGHSNDFVIANGRGYLYANKSDQTLAFAGAIKPYDADYTIPVTAGWNLVGNPYTFNAYANRRYYKINPSSTNIEPVANNEAVPPCTGIIVNTEDNDDPVTFTDTQSGTSYANQGNLQMVLAQNVATRGEGTVQTLDKAIVSFNEGSQLGKFYFGTQDANLYIPQDNEEYAIVSSNAQGEMPVNFKAHRDGQYTLTVNPQEVEMGYLHLIDNIAGKDIDLLQTPSYTFNAKADDYESRFRLVFVANANDGESQNDFAFISNGSLIVTGEGTLQIFDILGHQLFTKQAPLTSHLSTLTFKAGVYVLRLIQGTDVKTQKIIVK